MPRHQLSAPSEDTVELRNQLELCIEHCPTPIAMFDRKMHYLGASRRWLAHFNLQAPVLGRDHYDLVPETPERWKESHRRCLHGAVERCEEDQFVRADGSVDSLRWETRPWRNSRGQVGGIVIFLEVLTNPNSPTSSERRLRQSEERLRLAMAGADLGSWHWDIEKDETIWSERLCIMLGVQSSTATDKSAFLAALHPDDRTRADTAVRRALEQAGDYRIELRSVWPDGSVHWLDLLGRVYPGANGKAARMEGVALEITSRKQAELALRHGEAQLRNLMDGVPHLVHQLTPDGRPIYTNKRWRDFFASWRNVESGEIPTPSQWNEVIHPDDRAAAADSWLRVVRGEMVTCELRLLSSDGSYRWFAARTVPIYDESGCLSYIVGTATDIDDLKRTEAALHQSQALLQSALRAGGIGTVIWDIPTDRMQFDDALLHLLGRTREEVQRSGLEAVLAFVDPEDRAFARYTIHQALEHGTDYEIECRVQHSSGTTLTVTSKGRVECDDQRHPVRLIGAVMDITRHKQLERALLQAENLESVGQLASGVAHDFNNILTIILAQASSLAGRTDLATDVAQSVRGIAAAAERAAGLTSQLLSFGRRQLMRLEDLELTDTIGETLALLRPMLGESINLVFEPWPAPIHVRADSTLLSQVLINLALNARDAMSRGGRLSIRTSIDSIDVAAAAKVPDLTPGTWGCLEVTDTGQGIPPDVLPRVFEPFFTTKAVGRGTGLGLASVYGIVKQLRGCVLVDTALDQGTTFKVLLPIQQVPAAMRETRELSVAQPRGRGEVILLVEDDPSVRSVLTNALQQHGYRVIAAESGPDALRSWQDHASSVSLLLSDMIMPGDLTGAELAARLCALKPNLRVILSSGHGAEVMDEAFGLASDVTFLQKPYSIGDLLRTVASVLNSGSAAGRTAGSA